MTTHLFHGPANSRITDILAEGIDGPSYWGTLAEAGSYATPDGKLFRIPIERFEEFDLRFNDLLAQAMIDAGEDVPADGTWQESLERFGSVRYDGRMPVEEFDLVSLDDLEETLTDTIAP